mgnify:CR=1 FL=1
MCTVSYRARVKAMVPVPMIVRRPTLFPWPQLRPSSSSDPCTHSTGGYCAAARGGRAEGRRDRAGHLLGQQEFM